MLSWIYAFHKNIAKHPLFCCIVIAYLCSSRYYTRKFHLQETSYLCILTQCNHVLSNGFCFFISVIYFFTNLHIHHKLILLDLCILYTRISNMYTSQSLPVEVKGMLSIITVEEDCTQHFLML